MRDDSEAPRGRRTVSEDRLTVSLAPGQRQALEAVAGRNGVKLAFVVRWALGEFIKQNRDQQLRLQFPEFPIGEDDRARNNASDVEPQARAG